MQSIDSIETYAYRSNKNLISKKEKIRCNNLIKHCKMITLQTLII